MRKPVAAVLHLPDGLTWTSVHRRDANDPKTRIYATSLPYHVDRAADVVGLLCLQTAQEGGGL